MTFSPLITLHAKEFELLKRLINKQLLSASENVNCGGNEGTLLVSMTVSKRKAFSFTHSLSIYEPI